MEEYLNGLRNSELIVMMKHYATFDGADTVAELLLSREKKRMKRIEDLEKDAEINKSKCLELSNLVEEEKKKSITAEGQLEEFREMVLWLDGECDNISQREKKAESETEEERKKYEELEKSSNFAIEKLEMEMEIYKAKCLDLGTELQEKKEIIREVEGKLVEFKMYKTVSIELQEKVTRLEQDWEIITEREKRALENLASLSADLDAMRRRRNVECGEYKRALECEKQKAEDELRDEKKRYMELENKSKDAVSKLKNELEMQKRNCFELSVALKETKNKNNELQSKLEGLKEYEKVCGQLKDRVTCLEEKYNIVDEREKDGIEKNTTVLCGEEVRDHISVSVCSSMAKASSSGPVSEGEKRKVACTSGSEKRKRKVRYSPVRHPVTKESLYSKPGTLPVEIPQEKRQSKRTIHPPVRLDL